MAVQSTSGGTASESQFIDTVGGFTGIGGGGSDHQTISAFVDLTVNLVNPTLQITQFLSATLAALISATGYTPVKLFQFYKVKELTIWIMDIDYGADWTAEMQMWNVYLAPWRNAQYMNASNIVTIKPNYIPGCVWKNMSAPSTGSRTQASNDSSSSNQMLSIKIHNPAFEMETYGKTSSTQTGTQMNNTFIPTYSSRGLDTTQWHAAVGRLKRQSGYSPLPNRIYLLYMTKTVYEFTGLRCIYTSELDDYLPTDEDIAARQVITVYESNPNRNNMGNDTKNKNTDSDITIVHSEDEDNNQSPNRPPRKAPRRY